MFERLMLRGAAFADKVARRRRGDLAEALAEEVPAGVSVEEEGEAVVLSGFRLGQRFALEPALRWLMIGRRR
jgi:hypothetical protein